ncbi:hypothetical protein PoB_007635100 [Plakobranchus ocellatus]|uniref:Uncharacterized protein n=1 Tax=Plakobranchus ocellatus TaxID=259542 RepID=A0AAV4E164_9GAST|nr:hypothetical protein PoB_007635100 [Plakobranchus ocellatus]
MLAVCLAASCLSKATPRPPPPTTPAPTMDDRVSQLEGILHGLSRQVMLQQFFLEEKVRSDGNSGLKTTRLTKDGTRNFYQPAIIDRSYLAMHDHANYDRTGSTIPQNGSFGGTEDSEPTLRPAETLLLRVRDSPPTPWPNGGPESLRA